jgi:Leucine-rich repeat (LRR) protein
MKSLLAVSLLVAIMTGFCAAVFMQTPVQVSADDPVVPFPDPNLEAAIRDAISKPTGDIYQSDLDALTSLSASWQDIADITGLEYCTKLTYLYLSGNQISNISALSGLTTLAHLYLHFNQISNISALSGLTNLTYLYLDSNQISNISALPGLTKLTNLYLSDNQINDVSALSGLTNLSILQLGNNQISNISALSGLTNLTILFLGSNQISNISALSGFTNLTYLYLFGNQISDISTLSGLTNMSSLSIGNNQIIDISALSGLTSLQGLSVDSNQISDVSALSGLTNLQWLSLKSNQISNIAALSGLTNMSYLYLENNQISNISALSVLTSLTEAYLSSNQISDILPLVNNSGLASGDYLDLRLNPLNATSFHIHIPALQARSVTVDYTIPSASWVDDNYNESSCDGHIWGVDAFDKIQDGIDAVSGSTVHVAAGTYYENIVLKDGVELLGAGSATTIIDGMQNDSVVTAVDVSNTTVIDGFTVMNGSAIYNSESGEDCGGGMYNRNSSITISNCIFQNNRTYFYGLGIGMYNENSSPTVANCTFQNNMTNNYDHDNSFGGGMYNRNSSPIITDCIFQNNSANNNGGGIYNEGSSPVITSCTFWNNSVHYDIGGGIYNRDSSPVITNCILWDDYPDEIENQASTPVVTYCDVQGGYAGEGNIDSDPLFVNAAAGDFHLTADSPCIDAGNNSAPFIPSTDFEGDPRILPVWGTVDMGVDEYIHPTPSFDSWDVRYRIVGGQLTMNYSVANATPVKKIIPFSAEEGGMTFKFCKTETNGSRIVIIPENSWNMETFTVENIMTGVDMDLTINLDTDATGILYVEDGIDDVDVISESVAGSTPVQIDTIGDGSMDDAGSMLIPLTLAGEFNTSVGQPGELPFDMIFTTGNTTNVVSIPANPKMDGATMTSEGTPFVESGGSAPYVGTNGTITATGTGNCLGVRIVGVGIDFQFELKLQLEPIAIQEPAALYGDANDDDHVNATDISYIKAAILGRWGIPTPGADANGDGLITATDISYVKAYILGRWNGSIRYETTYDFSLGAGSTKWAKSNSVSALPPALSDNFDTAPDGWIGAGTADYENISLTDGNVWTIAGSDGNYSALQCRFTLDENPYSMTSIGITLNGSAETNGSTLQLWAWNFDTGAWRQVGGNISMTTDIASYSAWAFWGKVYSDYIDGDGYMYILVNLNNANQDLRMDYVKLGVAW